ncbi:sialate O-acetylesterase [Pseudoduganella namucuonensis]|uniref:Peptidoglycan/xylan/chitin deacetylase, PgdA/CDA1 family n=1 Tax=Pseudoduganella namucuonensis TaxID=1035707 RepID=A0A1I7LPR3_9BURK|nr:sialate O-acetylesterase [Pseudoduganella namucuonensis]SFV11668.1 Peptidoglycan/xylan/chitin deacetylase, PgdA/CDA1 family [Pseudoduganella namucuonensis]
MPRTALPLLPLLVLLSLSSVVHAAVRLPAVLSDHAVLQRGERVPVWGWADPGEEVNVRFGAQNKRARAGADGRWRVDLDLSKGQPAATSVSVRGKANEIVIQDVLVGEVWLGAGQSNMEKPLGERQGQLPTFNAQEEIAAASHPELRLFKVARKKSSQPGADVEGKWERCSPASIEAIKFSAAAYFFGRRLHQELKTPVGMIDASWGGTRIEPWTPGSGQDAVLFNGMVAGLAPSAIKGVLWYQGESNVADGEDAGLYVGKMEALVGEWRRHWGIEFPFYYTQLAPHLYHTVRRATVIDPQTLPRMWEAQADALRIPGTGMIGTNDLTDDLADIHPRDKKSIGLRLANLALARTYGRAEIVASGPVFRALAVDGARAVLSFDHADGLAARDGKPLGWFDIAGADGRYHAGTAEIRDGKVVVTSPKVAAPVAVRFGWDEAAQPNLVNRAGLPAMPFRSQRPAEPFDVAFTIDDLPAHGKLPPGMTWPGIAESHVRTLKAHGVAEAYGFVNAVKLNNAPDGGAALDAWRKAGYPLANHTYTHMSLERAPSMEAWKADVAAGEPAVTSRMAGADWRYLRFPYLNVGEGRKTEAFAYLKERGYRIADVSLSFSDWDYTDAYARCAAKGDTAAIAAMKAHYYARVDSEIARMKADSKRVFGRVIPQVLLTHMGGWSAETLPEVMSRLGTAGARYVTLAQAQADPAYAEPGGGGVIDRVAKQRGIALAVPSPALPALDTKSLCQ